MMQWKEHRALQRAQRKNLLRAQRHLQVEAAPVAEAPQVEAALAAAVPEAEVNLVEAAPVAENLPAVKVQNNV